MRTVTQVLAATGVGLRSIPQRLGNSLVIVIGMAGVVAVLVSVLAMSRGFQTTINAGARPDRVIVLVRGADSESNSTLSRAAVAALEAAPGIKMDAGGNALISSEIVLVAPVVRKRNNADAYITLRGVGARHFDVRPELKLVAGRTFEPGLRELIVGKSARGQFAGLELGSQVRLHDGDWTIVGVFAGGDNVRESEAMADAQTVLSSYQLDGFNSATALLESNASLTTFTRALAQQPLLDVQVLREPEYLGMVSRSINRLLGIVAYAIGGIMAVGALFSVLNTMYSAVTARIVELATMRAIGFTARAILASIVIEALLLAVLGSVIGVAIAYLVFDGRTISTLGGTRWDTQVVYALTITPAVVVIAVTLACTVGLLGGLSPALKAARASVADSLRAT
jgi:putative ABC transport system permease protein